MIAGCPASLPALNRAVRPRRFRSRGNCFSFPPPMRRSLVLPVIVCFATAPAFAQVTVDLHALDALPKHPSAPAPRPRPPHARTRIEAAARPSGRLQTPPAPVATPAAPSTAPAASSTVPAAPAATLPAVPPAVASIPPVAPPTVPANAAPPPPPPIVATAKTVAAKVSAGLQLTFASGQSDLSPASAAAIKQFVQATPSSDATTFNVLAYAANVPNDPSAPRRLSLSRAISVRIAMMADGVPSAAIYMRALGAQGGGGPPDRVDISVLGAHASSGAKSQ
jgi:outer membrane protein OmpA-like peptidoglycan-associated protein